MWTTAGVSEGGGMYRERPREEGGRKEERKLGRREWEAEIEGKGRRCESSIAFLI